jgi:dTDP-4-dehydrorhamnose reductase
VHYSTDYVFDGLKAEPYGEDEAPNPLNVYGASKLAGENSLRASGAPHLILRTSWVYAARGRNFVRTMLRLARERDELRVVADQVGAPTGAELIADVTALILGRLRNEIRAWEEAGGTYHLTATGHTSWHGLAQAVLTEALKLGVPLRAKPDGIAAIATADYPTRARRPANSRLATDRLRRTFGLFLPDWREGVTRTVREILAQGEP